MIKAIIFDIGSVYVKGSRQGIKKEVSSMLNINYKKFQRKIEKLMLNASKGKYDADDFISRFCEIVRSDKNSVLKAWYVVMSKCFKINKNVDNIVKELKSNGYKVIAITNTIKLHVQYHKKHGTYKVFDFVITSCDVKTRKPDLKIYKLAVKKLKISPNKIIFIDNKMKHLLPAGKLGMKTILFKNAKQLQKDLKKLGVL